MEVPMTNEILEAMYARRSCKKYKPDPVPREIIDAVIKAGLFAASGSNMQSPIILAVTDKETRDLLMRLNAKYDAKKRPDPFYGAPVVLPVLADKSVPTFLYDGSLAMGNMMLAAHSLGVGSCWIHRAKQVFYDPEGKAILDKLGITGDYEGVGNLILGYPEIQPTDLLPRRENRVFYI